MSTQRSLDGRGRLGRRWPRRSFCTFAGSLLAGLPSGTAPAAEDDLWQTAQERGEVFADCGRSARRLLQGWIDRKQDPQTHLFSRGGLWDYHNEAADHYSSLVLMARYVEPALIQEGAPLHRTLTSCRSLCSTDSGLPVTYDLRSGKRGNPAGFRALAEWLRDGLIRIVEILGSDNDWYREAERLTDAIIAVSGGPAGLTQSLRDQETRGNMLQTLSRLFAISGKGSYVTAAEEIGDAVLLRPRPVSEFMHFQDHGCELVPGLGELFALECQLDRSKAAVYQEPLRRLLDGILSAGAHPVTGLLCKSRPGEGEGRRWEQPTDTWGYVLFTYENYDRGTGGSRYRSAVEKPMRWLVASRADYASLRKTLWPRSQSSDDWSDSYESMIVLWNRRREVEGVFEWLDWATRQHVHRRHGDRPYGPFTGGHFDGSTGRTLSMHMMLCSQGVRCVPFAEGLRLGGVVRDGELRLSLETDTPWQGRLVFDGPRCEYPLATLDWARINEMPLWFVVRPKERYRVAVGAGPPRRMDGSALLAGLEVEHAPGPPCRIRVAPEE